MMGRRLRAAISSQMVALKRRLDGDSPAPRLLSEQPISTEGLNFLTASSSVAAAGGGAQVMWDGAHMHTVGPGAGTTRCQRHV